MLKPEGAIFVRAVAAKGQLNAALKSLESLGLKLPCVSLAKENEEVYLPKTINPVVIPKNKKSLQILQHARDETHRFGVKYNRTIRKNKIGRAHV